MVQRVVILSEIIRNSNSSQEQLGKQNQLSIHWQESNLRFFDAGTMLFSITFK